MLDIYYVQDLVLLNEMNREKYVYSTFPEVEVLKYFLFLII